MTRYELIENAYRIFINGMTEKQVEYINSNPTLKGNIYCTFVGFVEGMLHGVRHYTAWIDEINGEEINREILSNVVALQNVMETEAECKYVRSETYKNVIRFIEDNMNCIKSYLEYMEA